MFSADLVKHCDYSVDVLLLARNSVHLVLSVLEHSQLSTTYTRSNLWYALSNWTLCSNLIVFFFAVNPIHSLSPSLTMICKMTIFTYVQCIHHSWRPSCDFFFTTTLCSNLRLSLDPLFFFFLGIYLYHSLLLAVVVSCYLLFFSFIICDYLFFFLMPCCSIAFGKDSLDNLMFKCF